MATNSIRVSETPQVLYALRRADDSLILGHRLSEWCGHAPTLEEDMALANIGLDLIGQARSLYGYVAEIEPAPEDAPEHAPGNALGNATRGAARHHEDSYAYFRDVGQYRNLLLCEQPNGDFADTIVRQFFYSAFADPYWQAMMASTDATLAAIAAKSEKESAYHLRHSAEWVIRLGDGTDESRQRAQRAIDRLWAFTGEMFDTDEAERALIAERIAIDPATLREVWVGTVGEVLERATLRRPADSWMQRGGRVGRHSEHLGRVLAEMQHLQRGNPGAAW